MHAHTNVYTAEQTRKQQETNGQRSQLHDSHKNNEEDKKTQKENKIEF